MPTCTHAYPYIRAVDLDALAEHARELTSRTYTEGLVHGNANPDMARACFKSASEVYAAYYGPEHAETRDAEKRLRSL